VLQFPVDEEDTMSRGKASGNHLSTSEARIALGLIARGDREHDIAAWFGVNSGRVTDAKMGKYGTVEAAPALELPPKGAPGLKGRRLRDSVGLALTSLGKGNGGEAAAILKKAAATYDANEA
jgi:hypothetical protein